MVATSRRIFCTIAGAATAGVLATTCGMPAAQAASNHGVATTTVNIRSGPSTSAGIVGRLVRGQRISVTGTASGDWIKVRFHGGTAYLDREYLDRAGARPAAPKTIPTSGSKVATEDLNVRSGPSTRYRIVDEVAEGSTITITGRFRGGYAEFRHRGTLRWVYAAYLATSLNPGTTVSRSSIRPALETASSKGQVALAFARAQFGEPYVFGATGPDRWDCSGLSQAAWRAAGVSIPRTTYTQFRVGQRVARSDLRAGDLVFFYGPNPSHVGLYAGNGMILAAPRPGKVVSYSKISSMPYAGAVRPG